MRGKRNEGQKHPLKPTFLIFSQFFSQCGTRSQSSEKCEQEAANLSKFCNNAHIQSIARRENYKFATEFRFSINVQEKITSNGTMNFYGISSSSNKFKNLLFIFSVAITSQKNFHICCSANHHGSCLVQNYSNSCILSFN